MDHRCGRNNDLTAPHVYAEKVHRVRSKGASVASLHSKVTHSEEGLANRDFTGFRIHHLLSDSAQYVNSGNEGESVTGPVSTNDVLFPE